MAVSSVAYKLLTQMHSNQRLVFKSHSRRYFAQALAILSSSLFIFVYSYMNIVLNSCVISEGGVSGFYTDLKDYTDKNGVCGIIY